MSTSEISYHQLAMQGRDGSDRTVSCLCLAASCGLSADHHTFIFIFLFIFLKNKVKRENSFFFFFTCSEYLMAHVFMAIGIELALKKPFINRGHMASVA